MIILGKPKSISYRNGALYGAAFVLCSRILGSQVILPAYEHAVTFPRVVDEIIRNHITSEWI